MQSKIVIYQALDGTLQIEAQVVVETIWLPMADIAKLFGVNVHASSKRVKNISSTRQSNRREPFPKWKRFAG